LFWRQQHHLLQNASRQIGKSQTRSSRMSPGEPVARGDAAAAAVVDQLGAFRTFGSALCIAAMSELGGERI